MKPLSLECLVEESAWQPAVIEPEPSLEFDRAWACARCGQRSSEWRGGGWEAARSREFEVYRRFLPGSQVAAEYAMA